MSNFWNFVGAGLAVGAGAYAINELSRGDAQLSFNLYAGNYASRGCYSDFGWNCRPSWNAQPRICDWGFNGRASNAWAYRQGFNDGFDTARYQALPAYRGQYVPWWT